MLDLRSQLVKVAWELAMEFLCAPQTAEHAEKLPQLFHLIWSLENIELINVRACELLCHREPSDLFARDMVC